MVKFYNTVIFFIDLPHPDPNPLMPSIIPIIPSVYQKLVSIQRKDKRLNVHAVLQGWRLGQKTPAISLPDINKFIGDHCCNLWSIWRECWQVEGATPRSRLLGAINFFRYDCVHATDDIVNVQSPLLVHHRISPSTISIHQDRLRVCISDGPISCRDESSRFNILSPWQSDPYASESR